MAHGYPNRSGCRILQSLKSYGKASKSGITFTGVLWFTEAAGGGCRNFAIAD
ncbi:MAG: hypothetical protein ACYTE1_01870 [Planctomycetota bacterium]